MPRKQTQDKDITCPFCGEIDFDKIGLKDHLERFCNEYQDTISPFEERELALKLKYTTQKYCPDSCDSLYVGKCIMKLDGKDYPWFLFYDTVGLGKRYIRREDCPLRNKNVQ